VREWVGGSGKLPCDFSGSKGAAAAGKKERLGKICGICLNLREIFLQVYFSHLLAEACADKEGAELAENFYRCRFFSCRFRVQEKNFSQPTHSHKPFPAAAAFFLLLSLQEKISRSR
jgi:hypothetical protein